MIVLEVQNMDKNNKSNNKMIENSSSIKKINLRLNGKNLSAIK